MKKILYVVLFLIPVIAFSSGKIQKEDVKTEADLVAKGSDKSHLINDTQVYVSANSINERFDQAIVKGLIGGGDGGSGYNLLSKSNSGFESGVASKWTYTADKAIATNGGSFLLFDNLSAVFDADAAGQYIQSDLQAIPEGLAGHNCEGSIYVKGGDSNLMLKVVDGAGATLAEKALQTETGAIKNGVTFICPTSGSIRLRVDSTAAALPVALDRAHLGEYNTFQISQATHVGTITYTGTSNCVWTTSASSFSNFSADTDCLAPTVTGSVSAPATKIPGVVIQSVKKGTYLFIGHGNFEKNSTTNDYTSFRFSDGTRHSIGEPKYNGPYNLANGTLTGTIEYPSAVSNVTVQIQAMNIGGAESRIIAGSLLAMDLSIDVYYYPTESQTAVRIGSESAIFNADRGAVNVSIPHNTETDYDPAYTVNVDTAGGWNSSGYDYTVKSAGHYDIVCAATFDANSTGIRQVYVLKNGSKTKADVNGIVASPYVTKLAATLKGDFAALGTVYSCGAYQTSGGALDILAGNGTYIGITKSTQQIPQPILTDENAVFAKYEAVGGQSIAAGGDIIVDFATKIEDTHNAVTTGASWKFTCPVAGTYAATVTVGMNNSSGGNVLYYTGLKKNGSAYAFGARNAYTTGNVQIVLPTLFRCNAGDYYSPTIYSSSSSNTTASGSNCHIEFARIGQ